MKPEGVRSVARALEILKLLGERPGLSVTEIGRIMEMPKASTHEILTTLRSRQFIIKEESSGTYLLGSALFVLGSLARSSLDIVGVAEKHLRALNAELDETVHLTALRNNRLLYVDCVESTKRLRTLSSIGEIAELYCTAVGKAVLAFQPPDRQAALLGEVQFQRFTDQTILDRGTLTAELVVIVRRGYSVDNAEHEEGVRCIGAPIRNHFGAVFGSISLSGPSGRITPDKDEALAQRVKAIANQISKELGETQSTSPDGPGGGNPTIQKE